MRKQILQIVLFLVALCHLDTFAQTTRVTGRVVGPNNAPVAAASVTVSGSTQGTYTDDNGNFEISVPANGSLLVNAIGFNDAVIKVDGKSTVNVSLVQGESRGLEEVVVTGYTAQRKKDIVGSVAVVNVKELKAVPSGSVMGALQGQAAGVEVINTGSPSTGDNGTGLSIRGITGLSVAPLVLIDGVQGYIGYVPTNDVESVQILKDASASAIYGARGANGVIIITTKRGKSGVPVVSYDNYFNYQMPYKSSKLDLLSSDEYISILKQVNPASGLLVNGELADFFYRAPGGARGAGNSDNPAVNPSNYNFDPFNYANNYIISESVKGQGTSMYDEITRNALWMDHNINVTGGNDKANYLLSVGYQDRQGTLVNSFSKRYNIRFNSSYKIKENIRIGENINIQYTNASRNWSTNGGFGPVEASIKSLPYQPVYDIQGNYSGQFVGPGNNEMGDWGNSLATLKLSDKDRNRDYYMLGNVYMEVDFLKHFTARTSFGGSIGSFYNQTYLLSPYWTNALADDRLTEGSGTGTKYQFTNTLNYKNTFGKHSLNVLVGTEAIADEARNQTAAAEKFFSSNYNYLVLQSATVWREDRLRPTSNPSTSNLFSLIGKVNYSFNDRYLIDISGRRDGYSRFGADSKYGNFYAVGAAWRISQEEFMQNVGWLNDLKIRASYGKLGKNDGLTQENPYTTYRQSPSWSYYDLDGVGNVSQVGYYVKTYGNAETSWEDNSTVNFGIDATLFNKLDVVVDVYNKKVEGLLYRPQSYALAGEGTPPLVNLGTIVNKGIDISVNYRERISNDLDITVGAYFTTYKNEVTKFPLPGYFDETPFRREVGYPLPSFYGYKVIGLFQSDDDVAKSPVQQSAGPGRYKYLDADGDGEITPEDRVHFGDAIPAFTLGLNLGANFKNFDFSAQIYTSQGNDIINGLNTQLMSWENGVGNKRKALLNSWTPTNTDTDIKIIESGSNFSNSGVFNSAFMEDGSFVRLRSIMVGYSIPGSFTKRFGVNRLRFYVQGQNLITITSYSGLDPEVNLGPVTRGLDAGAYVQTPSVIFGLNLTF